MNTGTILSPAVDTDFEEYLPASARPALQQAAPSWPILCRTPTFSEGKIRPSWKKERRCKELVRGTELWRRTIHTLCRFSLASEHKDKDPRPYFLGSLLLCCGLHFRGALRASVDDGSRLDCAASRRSGSGNGAQMTEHRVSTPRRRHSPGRELWRRRGDLGAPVRTARGGRRSGLRPHLRLRL